MSTPTEAFKINLNQNLWALVVSYASLGCAEYYGLCTLYWLSAVAALAATLSVVATSVVYTYTYWKKKIA
jgi:glucan phosphoethanolaminetransferase (alkaline phosphatase superfamily)